MISDFHIDPDIKKWLEEEAPQAEAAGFLTQKQREIIYGERWFTLFVPQVYGGLALSLPQGLQCKEALARIDGSLGWTITLCAGASFFAGFLPATINQTLFSDQKICFAGSGGLGVAIKTKESYVVNGFWRYATGLPQATIFTANCFIEENGTFLQDENGEKIIRSFFFYREEVSIHHSWNMMGLKATASHAFEVKNCAVPADRCFTISEKSTTLNDPIYRYPFLQFAETTLAVNVLGMAEHFLDECELLQPLFSGQNEISKRFFEVLGTAAERVQTIRNHFYATVNQSWEEHLIHHSINEKIREQVSNTSRQMVRDLQRIISEVYPLCGMRAAAQESTINRIWRDLFTASQHTLLVK